MFLLTQLSVNLAQLSGLLLLLLPVAGLVGLAFTTAYCAQSHGRSFWLWFALGAVLPIVSFIALFLVLVRTQLDPGLRLLEEAKAVLRQAEAKEKLAAREE